MYIDLREKDRSKGNMGKQGPCYHCGVTSTPLWRNGPPDKPVLCNACGSRWRTKGSLVNYTPLHCRVESEIYEEHGHSHARRTSLNKEKHVKHHNRKRNDDEKVIRWVDSVSVYQKADEENSNRSSSGSAISDADAWFESADAGDLTGPARLVVQESMEPSRKRTCVNREKPSSVEKLVKDLHTILQEQQSSSCFSCTSDKDLLLERQMPTGSVEIGHGTILIRHQNESAGEDYKDVKTLQLLRNPGRQISPAESTIAGSTNSTRNLIGGRRSCNTENQKASGKTTIKSPKRFKPCPGDEEPANGLALIEAVDDSSGETDLLLDVSCNGSFPEGELLSLGSQQASNIS